MTAYLFEPHADDAVLFACFLALKHKPTVITVLGQADAQKSRGHQIGPGTRFLEASRAIYQTLGLPYQSWRFSDLSPDWAGVRDAMTELDRQSEYVDLVIAPAWEQDGNEQHNRVAELAAEVFPEVVRRLHYVTYTRMQGRSWGTEVPVEDGAWIALKHRALACYESQMGPGTGTREWFIGDMREWIA